MGRVYLKYRQCTILAVTRANYNLQVRLSVVLELWVGENQSQ